MDTKAHPMQCKLKNVSGGLLIEPGLCYEADRVRIESIIHQGGIKMLTVVARIPVKEGKMEEALKAFGNLIDQVAKEEGTVMYSLNKDKANPNMLVVVEQYRDKAALDFHSSTAHFKAFFAASGAFVGGKPEMSIMEQVKSI